MLALARRTSASFLVVAPKCFTKNLLPSFFFGFPVFGGVTPRGAGVERFASRLGDSMKFSVQDAKRVQVEMEALVFYVRVRGSRW